MVRGFSTVLIAGIGGGIVLLGILIYLVVRPSTPPEVATPVVQTSQTGEYGEVPIVYFPVPTQLPNHKSRYSISHGVSFITKNGKSYITLYPGDFAGGYEIHYGPGKIFILGVTDNGILNKETIQSHIISAPCTMEGYQNCFAFDDTALAAIEQVSSTDIPPSNSPGGGDTGAPINVYIDIPDTSNPGNDAPVVVIEPQNPNTPLPDQNPDTNPPDPADPSTTTPNTGEETNPDNPTNTQNSGSGWTNTFSYPTAPDTYNGYNYGDSLNHKAF